MLGPLEVASDGQVLVLGTPRARSVFSLLAFRRGHVVDVDDVIDVLWPGHRPSSAIKMVHNTVVALRRVLRDRIQIQTEASGYRLLLEPEALDAGTFESLALVGREALARRNWVHADRRLSGALSMWRGTPWIELRDSPPAAAESVRLTELHSVVEEDLIEARTRGGDHAAAVGDLEALVAEQPLRERRWAQLVTALGMSGRQAEALRAFQRARAMLADELGLEPGPELRAAEAAVLAADAGAVTTRAAGDRDGPNNRGVPVRLGLDPDLGALSDRRSVIDDCRVAADEARADGDFAAVVTHIARALDAVRAGRIGQDIEAQVLAELGHAQVRAGQPNAARASFLEAAVIGRAVGEGHAVAWAAIGLVGRTMAVEFDERVITPILDSALALLPPEASALRARALAAAAQWDLMFGDQDVVRTRFADATSMARLVSDEGALAAVLLARLRMTEEPHQANVRLDLSNEIVALQNVDDGVMVALAHYYRASALLDLGAAEWQAAADTFIEAAERANDPFLTYRVELVRAGRRLMRTGGDPVVYELLMSDRLMAFFADSALADGARREHLLTLRWFEGRLPELIPSIEEQAASAPDHPAWRSALALAYADAGRVDEARAIVGTLAAVGFEFPHYPNFWAPMMWHLTGAIAATNDAASAELLTDQLLPVADFACMDKVLYLGSVRHHLGVLARTAGRMEDARQHLAIAIDTHRRIGALWWVNRTAEELAAI